MKREELIATLDVGATIKKLRERKGISQEELAKGICDRSNLTKLENGHTKIPSLSFVLLICDKLEITIEDFLNVAMNNTYSLDKKKILYLLMNKENIELEKYINTIDLNLLTKADQRYYKLIVAHLYLINNDLNKGKEMLLKVLNNDNLDHINVIALHLLNKHHLINNKKKIDKLYSLDFIQSLMNKNSKPEYLYFINEYLEETINAQDIKLAKVLLEKEILFINLHELYRYLPIYYKNKIRIHTNNKILVKELENKILAIENKKVS